MGELQVFSNSQLATIKNTVASETNREEFDLFMGAAKSYGLDPFRKQISAIVFNKDNAAKRKMAIIVGRDGLRAIAQRCGDYRPASGKPDIEYDKDLIGPDNPKGIVSIAVELFKQDSAGNWFPVYGEAYWDEFAPVKAGWAYDQAQGKRAPTGEQAVDGNWKKMPVVMLTKCAEGQALRAGWPDTFGGLYAEEEMQQAQQADVTPSEAIDAEATAQRENAIGKGRSILMTLDDTGVFRRVEIGAMADKCLEFIKENDAEAVHVWSVQNRLPLQEFWAVSPNDALDVKKAIEKKTANVAAGL